MILKSWFVLKTKLSVTEKRQTFKLYTLELQIVLCFILPYVSSWKSTGNHPQVINYWSIMEKIICFYQLHFCCLFLFRGNKLHFILFLRVFNLTFSFPSTGNYFVIWSLFEDFFQLWMIWWNHLEDSENKKQSRKIFVYTDRIIKNTNKL